MKKYEIHPGNVSGTTDHKLTVKTYAVRNKKTNQLEYMTVRQNETEGTIDIDVDKMSKEIQNKVKRSVNKLPFQKIPNDPGGRMEDGVALLADFEKITKSMKNITEDGGLMKKVDEPGIKGKIPLKDSKVWINFTAVCEGVPRPVAQSDRTQKPMAFKLGHGGVPRAIDLGVATMELKERAQFLAKSEYAYKDTPGFTKSTQDSTIFFHIELVDFLWEAPITTVFNSNDTFGEFEKVAADMKAEGNRLCKENKWSEAAARYQKGIAILQRYNTVDGAVDWRRNNLLFVLFTNLAQCYLQVHDYPKAIGYSQEALTLPPCTVGNRCKAYYRQAKAQNELGLFELAKDSTKEALKIEPGNMEVREFHEKVCKRVEMDELLEREISKKMCATFILNKK